MNRQTVDGKTEFSLAKPLTRIEAHTLVYTGASWFKKVPYWAGRISTYAVSTGFAAGIDDAGALFASDRPAATQEFCAFLLCVLGLFAFLTQ
jgi:hypothetical protein